MPFRQEFPVVTTILACGCDLINKLLFTVSLQALASVTMSRMDLLPEELYLTALGDCTVSEERDAPELKLQLQALMEEPLTGEEVAERKVYWLLLRH